MPTPIPFVATISANTPNLTGAQKQALLADWCYAQGYEDEIYDFDLEQNVPNPESKSDFMDRILTQDIKSTIVSYRKRVATAAIVVEEPDI